MDPDLTFTDIEVGFQQLISMKEIRDKMCGDLYWQIMMDNCLKIADRLAMLGRVMGNVNEVKQRVCDIFPGELESK